MYFYKDILHLDLEMSSLCNLKCPICNRRQSGGKKNTGYKETYLSLERFKQWFDDEFVSRLYSMQICGNYGDAMTNPELIDILRYIIKLNPDIVFTMNSNASGRNEKFWSELGEIFSKNFKSLLTFSVDGLEDTNHIYRRGAKWDKIMIAMKSFINAGGPAAWEYLVFKHNQHQVEDAKKLAKELGFQEFYEKAPLGFTTAPFDYDGNRYNEWMRVFKDDNSLDYVIEPKNPSMTNQEIKFYLKDAGFKKSDEEIIDTTKIAKKFNAPAIFYKSPQEKAVIKKDRVLSKYETKLGTTKIDCMVIKPKSIFVAHDGLVFPCCFTASKYYGNSAGVEEAQLQDFINEYGTRNISLEHNHLRDIIDGPMFQGKWPESFEDNDIRNKRLITCSLFCGKETNENYMATKESVQKKANALGQ